MAQHNLDALVNTLVPQARTDSSLRRDLAEHCQEILNSHLGHGHGQDLGHLTDLVKRHLLSSSSSSEPYLRFTNLLSRLLDQPVLSKKYEALLFLHSVASLPKPTPAPSFLPSLAPPPPSHRSSVPSQPSLSNNITPTPQPKGRTKADILREFRQSQDQTLIQEHVILRDTLYLLQGISGKYVQFSNHEGEPNTLIFLDDARTQIPAPTRTLIHRLAEVGYLYKRVDSFIRLRERRTEVGMIEQSLCHHLQAQLTEYYRLIAVLESQMAMSAPASGTTSSQGQGQGQVDGNGVTTGQPGAQSDGMSLQAQESGLTLRRLDVWINEWRLRLRMMSVCVEGAKETHGGALVNLIHGYTSTGDPFVRTFTDQLLEDVSTPFFASLHRWLFAGELYDPFREFFVAVDPELESVQYSVPMHGSGTGHGHMSSDMGFGGDVGDVTGEGEGAFRLWENKYQFIKEMLPAFVSESFGRKIFSTGKSLNFIRYSCHDSDWVATRDKVGNTGGTLKYGDISGLERSIDAAYEVASQRLFEVFLDKFHLLSHLRALKNFLLLGHGDFVDTLMDSLGPTLSKPANTLSRHILTATLESAVRATSASQDSPDVLRRLDARMLEYSHGELGWEVFTLEYRLDAPVDAIVDPDATVVYKQLFGHLWQLKRIERVLGQAWTRIIGGSRLFQRALPLEHEWHQIRIVLAEMIHFVREMQAYCQLEVIECAWQELLEFVHKKDGDLDSLIRAHRSYLDRMRKKVLLLNTKVGREENLLNQVRSAFAIILQFRDATESLYNYCLTEAARNDQARDEHRGVYTGLARDNDATQATMDRVLSRVKEYAGSFSEQAKAIVHALQEHRDLDCRFLAIRLSFSDYYKTRKD